MQIDDATLREKVRGFVLEDLLLGDSERLPSDDSSLLETGVIDSTGILELIEFLEQNFGIQVADNETIPENLDGIDRVVSYVLSKRS
ncbi:MAG: acyl carrier protein [Acidipropionibacterium jensenii]|uniref:acyl carrier protein n=1 Tax=Acidipropionibacterium jensenii TaxID=1749 RepID=UPI00110B8C90|nr:acyl carrier protein [Acidipropionibacterium jensenii]MDN5976432.1 acyl carrier protein [Acidipropionibacterium jensenii]QCV88781.1 acyl carrier protein [Acidipropionibacterium jensenii]